MAATIHPNLLPPDCRATFQIALIPSRCSCIFWAVPGIRAAMPLSKRWITRNTGREFNERTSTRTSRFNLTPGLAQLVCNFPRE